MLLRMLLIVVKELDLNENQWLEIEQIEERVDALVSRDPDDLIPDVG